MDNINEIIYARESSIRDQIHSLEKRFMLAKQFHTHLSAEYKETERLLGYFYNFYMQNKHKL